MREIVLAAQFKRDVKLAEKRHKDMSKLRQVFYLLARGEILPSRYRDHPLGGDWKHHRDLHVEPDWLLIYTVSGDSVFMFMVRTGTHADIF
jgi:mRNA interferase YafQ